MFCAGNVLLRKHCGEKRFVRKHFVVKWFVSAPVYQPWQAHFFKDHAPCQGPKAALTVSSTSLKNFSALARPATKSLTNVIFNVGMGCVSSLVGAQSFNQLTLTDRSATGFLSMVRRATIFSLIFFFSKLYNKWDVSFVSFDFDLTSYIDMKISILDKT